MKRFFALAALVLGMVSCQTEPEGFDVIVGGEVESFVTVSITETTRATSADSGLTNVNPAAYDLRYILEVYDKENDVFVYRDVQTVETDVKSVSFPVRLIPERDYNFVVWADFVTNGSEDDLYYNTLNNGTNGLNAVTIADGKWVAMDEARDAYTAVALVEKYNSGKSINLNLIRPFGKLRVVTTDIEALEALAYDALPTRVGVEYKTKVYSGFNALTQTAEAAVANAAFAYNLADVYDYVDANATSLTLFTDYIFGTETGTIQFDMTVTYENGNVATNSFNTEIPVKRNYLTTITGDILTDGNNIKVDVKDEFENEENPNNPPYYQETISSAADFFAAVNEGGEYIIISDITISSVPGTLATTRAAASKSTTIDLNGYTITVENKTGAALITLTDGQTIVFEGEGEITLTDDSTAEFIDATNGCVVVEGGDVEEDVVDGNFFDVENNDEDSLALLQYICNNGGTFTFTRDIVGNVTVVQKEGVKVNIDGNGFKFNGEFRVHSNSNYYAGSALTIKNVNFETSTADVNFIEALENGSERYSQNITVENCTFTATGEAVNKAVAVQVKASRNVTVKGCTATNLHSLVQAQSCDTGNVKVINCTINGKGGVAFKAVKYAFVEGTTINATGYGIRFDGNNPNYSIVVKDNKVTAAQPLIVRRMTSQNNTITLEGTNTLTTESAYQIVITNGEDDAAYAIPTGTYTLTGAEGYSIFPMYADVYTEEELVNAFANGANFITLYDDITLNDAWIPVGNSDNPWCGVFDGKGHTIDGLTVAGVEYAAFISHSAANSCVKNVSFTNVNLQSTKHAATVVCVAEEGLTLENITVTGEITAASYAGGIMHNGANATITNCVNNANITANRAGGIASWVTTGANIENVTNNGKITGSVGASGIAHGFAGSIKNATNKGEISSANLEAAGGIVGVQKAASTYEYCYNYGNVTSTFDNPNASAAGILGQSAGSASTLKYCANYGKITAEQSVAAGIAYSLYGTINASYCYNEGAVEGADSAGGIAPKAQYGTGDKANYCLNAGVITSTNGIVYQGSNNNTSSFYYNDGVLYNVTGNTVAEANTALQILNGGADTDFFSMENSMITVK